MLKLCIIHLFFIHIIIINGNYRYNTFSSTSSPIETVNHLVRELKREVSDIRKEMRTKLEVVKYEINCEIKNLRDELLKDGNFKVPSHRSGLSDDFQGLKKRLKKSLKGISDQGEEIKNELRSQKAEMYAIRNSVYDSKEDIMEKGNMILRNIQNTNGTFMCYLNDLRMQLFKINTNFGMIKRDQERIKDLIHMTQQTDREQDTFTTEETFIGDPFGHEKYLPGCTTNPLETQETLQTFGSYPIYRNFSYPIEERGRDYGHFPTPEPTRSMERGKEGSKRKGIESLFPSPPGDCQDAKKIYLEYPPMPRDCRDAFDLGFMESGVYRIQPPGLNAREALCDHHTAGGGWTVIVARRKTPKHISFNRTWAEYEEGFGDPTREYWIGLKPLHLLTQGKSHQLRAELEDWEGNTAWAAYNYFSVAAPQDKYRLRVSGYSGTAGDSMRHSHLQMFSTIDQDNDQEDSVFLGGSCPRGRGGGGWWWGRCACTQPTGQYRKGRYQGPEKGITWWHWKDSNYSLKTLILMIRPRD